MILKEEFLAGKVLLFDKPLTWTSFDVVNKVRGILKKNLVLKKIKVGHAGTLDPLATGLLILCTGKATKRIIEFQDQEKEYTGIITLGATTPSYDLESEIDQTYPIEHINLEALAAAAKTLTGEIEQTPPAFSAKKINGKRAYDIARAGETPKLKNSIVQINSFEITKVEIPQVYFKINCSKGTYIRSIAHDFGKELASGAHLSSLRRTKIGAFSVDDSQSVDKWEEDLITR